MKRVSVFILSMILIMIMVPLEPMAKNEVLNNEIQGQLIDVKSYDNGCTVYTYKNELNEMSSIQPYAATGKTFTLTYRVQMDGIDCFRMQHVVTFSYNRPDNNVVIISGKASVIETFSSSAYYPDTPSITWTTYNGVVARFVSEISIYRKSDSSKDGTLYNTSYCYNDGTYK